MLRVRSNSLICVAVLLIFHRKTMKLRRKFNKLRRKLKNYSALAGKLQRTHSKITPHSQQNFSLLSVFCIVGHIGRSSYIKHYSPLASHAIHHLFLAQFITFFANSPLHSTLVALRHKSFFHAPRCLQLVSRACNLVTI